MADYSIDISEALHLTAGIAKMSTAHNYISLGSGITLTANLSDIVYLAFNSVSLSSGITLTGAVVPRMATTHIALASTETITPSVAKRKDYVAAGVIASTQTLSSSLATRKDYVADGAIASTTTITPSVTVEEFEIYTPLTTKTHWFIISGNAAQDVADQLSDQGVPEHKVKAFFYDSDNNKYVTLYHR
jgi:hypothetical protein